MGVKTVSSGPESYWDWQFESSKDYFIKFWDLLDRIPDSRVLDIGCGLGGRTCYLATKGVRSVVGIDINSEEIAKARELVGRLEDPGIRGKVSFVTVCENEPLKMEPFDIVVMADSMEHVHDPVAMFDLAYSMTRQGGLCYFGTIGWYYYNAAHLMGILPVPFATVFFRDKTILDAVRGIVTMPEYQPSIWDSTPPIVRWEHVTDLCDRPGEHLNKITLSGLRRAMKDSRFGGGRLHVAGFSWSRYPWMKWLNVLAAIPVIREAYHSGCFGRLER